MVIIISGGTGFIGSFLAREFLNNTTETIILFDFILNKSRITDIISNSKINLIQGDVSNWADTVNLFKKFDDIRALYHFGSLMPPYTEEQLNKAFQINIMGTFNVLECAKLFQIPKIVYSSSGAIYGPGVDLPVTEKSYRDPWTFYGVGKVCSEVLGAYYHRRQGIKFVTIRFPALIGPGRIGKGMTMWANNIIQYPAQGERAICNVEPDVSVPMLYIKDVTKLLADIIDRDLSETAFNLDGYWLKAKDLEKLVKNELPDAVIEYDPDPVLSFQLKSWEMMKGDDSQTRKLLEFSPKFNPETIVSDFIEDVKKNSHFQI